MWVSKAEYEDLKERVDYLAEQRRRLESHLATRDLIADLRRDNIAILIGGINEAKSIVSAAERELDDYVPEVYAAKEVWEKWSLAEKVRYVVAKLKVERDSLRDDLSKVRRERDKLASEMEWLRESEAKHYEYSQALCGVVEPYIKEEDKGLLFHVVIQRILNRLTSRVNAAEFECAAREGVSRELSEVVALYQHDGDENYILPERARRVIERLANSIIAMRSLLGHAFDISKLSVPE